MTANVHDQLKLGYTNRLCRSDIPAFLMVFLVYDVVWGLNYIKYEEGL